MSLNDFSGKTAIVTGGGSGISLAFTLRLLEAGCDVIVADLALSPEAEALNKYTETPRAIFQKTDVTDWAQLDAAFKAAHVYFGRIDIVCTGAGLSEPVSHSEHLQDIQLSLSLPYSPKLLSGL
jgi:3-hydroxybutyrate dehydrogenase